MTQNSGIYVVMILLLLMEGCVPSKPIAIQVPEPASWHPNAWRFYFDPNSIPMPSGDAHFIVQGFAGTSTGLLRVELRFLSSAYQLRASLLNDGAIWISTDWFTITDAPHYIEIDWRAATTVGANDGGLTLWIDGIQQQDLLGIDNDARRIDHVRLGALTGLDAGTRGTYCFDTFESRRQTYMGP